MVLISEHSLRYVPQSNCVSARNRGDKNSFLFLAVWYFPRQGFSASRGSLEWVRGGQTKAALISQCSKAEVKDLSDKYFRSELFS